MLTCTLRAPMSAAIALSFYFLTQSVQAQEDQASKFMLSGYRNSEELQDFITRFPTSSRIVDLIGDSHVTYKEASAVAIRLGEMKSPQSIPVQLAMFKKLYSIKDIEKHVEAFPGVKDSAAKYSLHIGGEEWLRMFGNNEYTDTVVFSYLGLGFSKPKDHLHVGKFKFLVEKEIMSRYIDPAADTLIATIQNGYQDGNAFDRLEILAGLFPSKLPVVQQRALALGHDYHWRDEFLESSLSINYRDSIRQVIRMDLINEINNATTITNLQEFISKDSSLYDIAEARAIVLISNYRDCISYEDIFPDGTHYEQVKKKYQSYIKAARKDIDANLKLYEDWCNWIEKTIVGWRKNSLNARNDLNDFLINVDPLDKFLDQHSDVFTEKQSDRYSRIHNRLRDLNTRARMYIRN